MLPDDIIRDCIFIYLKVKECLNTQIALQKEVETQKYYRFRYRYEPRTLLYQNILFKSHYGDNGYCVNIIHELSNNKTIKYKVSIPTANSTHDAIQRTKKFLCHPPEMPIALTYSYH